MKKVLSLVTVLSLAFMFNATAAPNYEGGKENKKTESCCSKKSADKKEDAKSCSDKKDDAKSCSDDNKKESKACCSSKKDSKKK